MRLSWRLLGSDELHAELLCALGELPHDAFTVALLVVVLAPVGIFLALGQHRVDRPRQLVGGGGNGLGFVQKRYWVPEFCLFDYWALTINPNTASADAISL